VPRLRAASIGDRERTCTSMMLVQLNISS